MMSFAHVHAARYAAILAGLRDVEVRASDPDHTERAGEAGGADLAGDLGVGYVDTYEELLAGRPDAVLVCSENARHRAHVELSAAAGVPVLCEKPLATSVADGRAMVAACAAAGVALMVAHPVRFSPAFGGLRHTLASGALGELVAATGTNNGRLPEGRRWFTDPALAGGGALTDHTVHLLDLMDDLLSGTPVSSVYATSSRLLHPELAVETAGLVSVRYANGVLLTIDCSWSRPATSPTWGGLRLQLVGSGGVADLDAFATRVAGHDARTGRELWLPSGPDLDRLLLMEFLSAIREGRRPQPDGESGLRALRVLEAAYTSAASGQEVAVAPAS